MYRNKHLSCKANIKRSLDQGTTAPRLTSETVRYWSDYNRVFYHPRSIVQLNEYELHSQVMPFEDWNVGEDLFQHLDKEHDLLDRDVRPFAQKNVTNCELFNCLQDPTTRGEALLLGILIGYGTSMERRVSGSGPLKMGREYNESV